MFENGHCKERDATMYCTKCGKQIPDGKKFCIYCGAALRRGLDSNKTVYTPVKDTEKWNKSTKTADHFDAIKKKVPEISSIPNRKTLILGAVCAVVVIIIVCAIIHSPAGSYEGYWVYQGSEVDPNAFTLEENGTGMWTTDTDSEALNWTDTGDGVAITIEGDTIYGDSKGNMLVFEIEGHRLEYEKMN